MFHPLLIGCPIWKREWAIPHWFRAAEQAAWRAGAEPAYVVVADPRDRDTLDILEYHCEEAKRDLYIEWIEESPDLSDQRHWNHDRYRRMVYLRNCLLETVRAIQPAYFLSLDSDIFLHQQAIVNMMEHVDTFAAVGGKTFMTPKGYVAPSYCRFDGRRLVRPNVDYVIEDVDVIMAIKLMTPAAYKVDYEFHEKGEDIGWSLAVRRAGLRLCWDGRVTSKHAMKPEAVDVVDMRAGF